MKRGALGVPRPLGLVPTFGKPRTVDRQSMGEIDRAFMRIRDRIVERVDDEMNQLAARNMAKEFAKHQQDVVDSVNKGACFALGVDLDRLILGVNNELDFFTRNVSSVTNPQQVQADIREELVFDYLPTLVNAAGCGPQVRKKIVDNKQRFEQAQQTAPGINQVAQP